MLDFSLRREALADERDAAVLLLDVVLGHGAHEDPAGELTAAIAAAGRPVIVALCGAEGDPQDLGDQRRRLEAAGAVVVRSNAAAARLARRAAAGG
jgi:FdrA protein